MVSELLADRSDRFPYRNLRLGCVIRPVRAPRKCVISHDIGRFPFSQLSFEQFILGGRLIDHIRDPCMPARFHMSRIEVMFHVIHPSCTKWQFFFVLKVLVSEFIHSDKNTGLGVTNVLFYVLII